MSDQADGFGILLAFDRDDPQFIYGFECGCLWRELELRPDDEMVQTVHAVNAEMMLRIADKLNRPVVSHELGDEWLEVKFGACAKHEDSAVDE